MRTALRRRQLRQEQRRHEEGMVVQLHDAGQAVPIDADELQSRGLQVILEGGVQLVVAEELFVDLRPAIDPGGERAGAQTDRLRPGEARRSFGTPGNGAGDRGDQQRGGVRVILSVLCVPKAQDVARIL
jgi:hypothetical protein